MSETAAASNVPVSVMGVFYNDNAYPAIVIGKNYVSFSGNPNTSCYWLVVVDLTNLNVVVNTTTNSVTVPPAVQQYVGNSQYFLFCVSVAGQVYNVPHGDFYTFLQQVGSGPQLAAAEQIIGQMGTAIIHTYSYILAATMDTTDYPGFEAFSTHHYTLLAMQFMPVTVNGQTIYAPINPFAS
jgi:hypothetical protein